MKPIFYYLGKGKIKTDINPPLYLVEIIANNGKHGGTVLIMTEGELDPEIKIIIKKGVIEEGLHKKITGKFYRFFEEDKLENNPPLDWCVTIGPSYTIDYSCRTIIVRSETGEETIDTLISLANGELVVTLLLYRNEEEGMKMIL